MKISNEKILNDLFKLQGIAQKPLPIKASYAIAKNISHLESELKTYEKERLKLIDKYAEKDEKGQVKADEKGQVTLANKEAWDKDIKELLSIENEVEIHKFNIDVLEGYSLSPAEIMLINYMIEE